MLLNATVVQRDFKFLIEHCCVSYVFTARMRRMGEGSSFSLLVCPREEGRGYLPWPGPRYQPPTQIRMWGGDTPRYLPHQSGGTPRYLTPLAKVPTPSPRSGWGEGVSQGAYPWPKYLPLQPGQDGDRGYAKVPTPWPRYLPPTPA